ncbi:MAG: flagellar hook-associated protein FlgK [Candidimonas sp.]|nr:MAG: flagellar hook-associated protein FlgK [Candidimonas sp.]
MNLANLGLTGLNAAQLRLQTAGHNINNSATDGYNRQSVQVSSADAMSTGSGFIGQGVQVDSITRSYDSFLSQQLVNSQSGGAALDAYGNQIAQVNNLFADRTVGISPALQQFFDGMQAVASAPADSAARQDLLGRAASLVTNINSASAFLNQQRNNINTQISTAVTQVNSYVSQIKGLNQQIVVAQAGNPTQPPNDLLDKRDQVVSQLSQIVNVKTSVQGGNINLTVGNGQILLGGDTVFPLQAVASAADPSRTVVAYSVTSGINGAMIPVEMSDQAITGGSLGGLLSYRTQALDTAQNQLGQMAAGLAMNVNTLHDQGVDLNGAAGTDFFALGNPKVIPNAVNSTGGAAALTASFVTTNSNQLTGLDYQVKYDGANYSVFTSPAGNQVGAASPTLAGVGIPGLLLAMSGTPAAGDSWLVQPTRTAADDLKLQISDPAKIAAADSSGGSANGINALALAQLQTSKVLGNGTMNLNESYAQVVDKVAVLTQQNTTASTAQTTLIQQNTAAQQALSGVNLNEEYVNLDNYQQQFQAASRLITVSSKLFDTLLNMGP